MCMFLTDFLEFMKSRIGKEMKKLLNLVVGNAGIFFYFIILKCLLIQHIIKMFNIMKVKTMQTKEENDPTGLENSILPDELGAPKRAKTIKKKGLSIRSINVEDVVLTDQLMHKKMTEIKNLFDVGNKFYSNF